MARLTELPGRTLDGKYHLDKLLGQGGMGAVYMATHLGTKRPVALKVIAPQFMGNEEFVERFRREAEAAGRLRHPNVVNVTDFGFTSSGSTDLAYLVMEYLDGGSLADMLKERGRLPLGLVIDIVEQICLAVNMAHEQGIIHRDLKPDNIWLQPDQRGGYNVKVLDFGLAKLHDAAPSNDGEGPAAITRDSTTQVSRKAQTIRAIAATNLQRQEGTEIEIEAATRIQSAAADEEQTLIFDQQRSAGATDPEAVTQLQPPAGKGEERTVSLSHHSASSGVDLSAASASNLTRVGAVMGTPLYMSPEQCRGDLLDIKSDIYSLGVIIYQMLAGAPPFNGDLNELIEKHTSEPPAPLTEKRNDMPRSVSEIVMSALAKDPAARPENASAFAMALRAAAERDVGIVQEGRSYYYNHLPGFLFLSLIINLPLAIVSVMFASRFAKSTVITTGVTDAILWIVVFLIIQVAGRLNVAACALAIHGLRLRPSGSLRIRFILFNLIKRLPSLLITSLLADLISLANLARLILPGLKSFVNYSLVSPVVVMEKKAPMAALSRSKALADRLRHLTVWATIRSISFVICSILFLPALIVTVAVFAEGGSTGRSVRDIYSAMLGFGWFFIILFYSYNSLPLVLIYYKSRQALGETLEEAAHRGFDQEKMSKHRGLLNRKVLFWVITPAIMMWLFIYMTRLTGVQRQDSLSTVVSRGRYRDVKSMLAAGADPNERTYNGRTPIMSAAGQGYVDVVKALIEAGADVNAKDGDDDDALIQAAAQGRTDIARLLIAAGANVNAPNKDGDTALIVASRRGFVDYVKTLLASGADVSAKDKKGKTALEYAEEEERASVVEALKQAGAGK